MNDHIQQIRDAINAFDVTQARTLLRDALKNPDAEIFYLASMVALNDTQKRDYLQKAVAEDPFHEAAHHELARLVGLPGAHGPAEVHSKNAVAAPVAQADRVDTAMAIKPTSSDEPIYVIGNVALSTPLYALPSDLAPYVSNLSMNTDVIVFSRREQADWIYCIHLNSLGGVTKGWLPSDVLRSIHVGKQHVNLVDIPITRYEGHTRHEIERLADLMLKGYRQQRDKLLAVAFLFFIIPCLIVLLGIIEKSANIPTPILIGLGLVSAATLVWMARERKRFNHVALYLEAKELKKMVKTDAERFQDRQFQQDLLKTAASIGGNMLTRYVLNRQEITRKRR